MQPRLTQTRMQHLTGYLQGLVTEVAFAAALAGVAMLISLVAFMVWR